VGFGRFWAGIEAPLLVTFAFFVVLFEPIDAWPWWRYVLAVATVGLIVLHWRVRHHPGPRVRTNAVGRPVPEEVDHADLIRAEEFVTNRYSAATIECFVQMLARLPDYLPRVDERMEVDGAIGLVQTRLTYRQPSTIVSREHLRKIRVAAQGSTPNPSNSNQGELEPETILVPLVSVRKGLLFDGFEACNGGGAALPTLSQWEVRGLLLIALRALFLQALIPGSESAPQSPYPTKVERHIPLQVAKRTICATLGRDKDRSSAELQATLKQIDVLDDSRFSSDWKGRIKEFCASLARDYVIVVEVPRPKQENFVLSYRHRVTAAKVSFKLEERRRAKHGLAPVVVDAPMTWALRPDSYHFELQAPKGQFVYEHHLEELESNKPLKQSNFQPNAVQQYLRVRHEQGHSLAHLYMRRVRYATESSSVIPDFKSVIRFKEVPPGVLGSAVTSALFTALVISYYAFIHGAQPNSSTATSSQAVLTLLLAIPAFLAAALGRGITSESLSRASLTTFYGLWTMVATSLASVFLFLFDINRFPFLKFSLYIGPLQQDVNAIWTSLALFSITMYIWLRKMKSDQRRYYLEISKKVAIARNTN
jgi:hypothetical protein